MDCSRCKELESIWEDLIKLRAEFAKLTGVQNLYQARERLDRVIILAALAKHNGNVTKASREIGISRPTLHSLIRQYDLRPAKHLSLANGS